MGGDWFLVNPKLGVQRQLRFKPGLRIFRTLLSPGLVARGSSIIVHRAAREFAAGGTSQ